MTTSPSISSATRLSETPRGAPCASTNRLEACECYDCYCRHPEVQGKVPRTRWKRLIWTFQAGKAMPHCWTGDLETVAGLLCTATVQDITNLWTIGLWTTQTKGAWVGPAGEQPLGSYTSPIVFQIHAQVRSFGQVFWGPKISSRLGFGSLGKGIDHWYSTGVEFFK